MPKPVLFAVDDDPDVLRAVERDLRHEYGKDYRIVRASSGAEALDALRTLDLRGEAVALFLVDQRMPEMTGVEFLAAAAPLFPLAKRVLLTGYADTDAAVSAINRAKLDYYLLKPWDPPEQQLYPVLEDLLADWRAAYRPAFEGVRVIGHRYSPTGHTIRDFLARNHVPYQWLDLERDAEAARLLAATNLVAPTLPLVILPDGSVAENPEIAALAEQIGLKTRATSPFYDLIVVGGGPAGLAAAVYGASEGLQTVLIERDAPGGQAGTSSRIENYLGSPAGLSGGDLARRAVDQARKFNAEILSPQEVTSVRVEDPYRFVTLTDGSELSCHALLIATGVSYRTLDVPGIASLNGVGVYYGAAITEAVSCADGDVYIVGGANSAGQAAMYLSRYARGVTLLVRGPSLAASMSRYLIDQINATPNICVLPCANVVAVEGDESLERITIRDANTGETHTVPAAALFVFIGATPQTDWLAGVVARDDKGFIFSGPDVPRATNVPHRWPLARDPYLLETSVPGVFVAGDVRHQSVKRVASGVGEGSIAVQFVHQYLAQFGGGR